MSSDEVRAHPIWHDQLTLAEVTKHFLRTLEKPLLALGKNPQPKSRFSRSVCLTITTSFSLAAWFVDILPQLPPPTSHQVGDGDNTPEVPSKALLDNLRERIHHLRQAAVRSTSATGGGCMSTPPPPSTVATAATEAEAINNAWQTLDFLMSHLGKVVAASHVNMMSAYNLGVCLAPAILQDVSNPIVAANLVGLLIANWRWLNIKERPRPWIPSTRMKTL